MSSAPSEKLEVFDNPAPERDYVIHMEIPEFTCLCPLTGQPDFATLIVDYIADEKCLELKSIKLYTWTYREMGAFHEDVTNRILSSALHAYPRPVVGPRRHLHHGDRRAPQGRLDPGPCRASP